MQHFIHCNSRNKRITSGNTQGGVINTMINVSASRTVPQRFLQPSVLNSSKSSVSLIISDGKSNSFVEKSGHNVL